ncbi:serine protease [Patescibacteria group bacterium]|nr:serine protease [Patescibacteria group bacterium]MBU4057773.1 serine protease [Patescibacteria group bacterium]MBU4115859.1 serine protease [Patescibacteria group bacterium]
MSLLPSGYLNAVVSIEVPDEGEKFRAIATGFLVGFPLQQKNKKGEQLFRIFLVTNRHVFRGKKEVWLRFNKGEGSRRYNLLLVNERSEETWSAHPNPSVDVGVVPIAVNKLQEDGVEFGWIPEELMAFRDKIKSLGITQGDEIFVLGFPMGLAGEVKKYAITRAGIIARLDDEIMETTHAFLIDCSVFPGNSGGPVMLKPAIVSIEGTTPINRAYLLGVIKGYLPYEEIAYSLQSDPPQPRVKFMENSGLALVVPLDYVRDIVSVLMPKKEPTEQEEKQMATEENKKEGVPTVTKT